ncbi:dihydrofolate reductase family protein [Candidatus Saccharibacteria bacterium]|nr:dihydrofolate reductase family protein [Candidatus Saccharibacteria bacterium]
MAEIYKIVVSSDTNLQLEEGYNLTTSPRHALELLREQGTESALVDGGGKLNASFLREGLVHEIHLIIEPVMIGKGLPIIAPDAFEVRTSLISVEEIHKEEVLLKYKVEK